MNLFDLAFSLRPRVGREPIENKILSRPLLEMPQKIASELW